MATACFCGYFPVDFNSLIFSPIALFELPSLSGIMNSPRKKRSTDRIEITCRNCKIKFKVANNRQYSAKFCSNACKGLNERIKIKTNCAICKKEFEHISSRVNKAKYCSRKCYYKSETLKWRGTKEFECNHCHKKFMDSPCKDRKFCSKKCVGKESKKSFKPNFTTVRKAMISRGLINQCNRCGYNAEPRILGVHHKDRNRHNNDMQNLEVLCPNCHSLEHLKHISHGFRE